MGLLYNRNPPESTRKDNSPWATKGDNPSRDPHTCTHSILTIYLALSLAGQLLRIASISCGPIRIRDPTAATGGDNPSRTTQEDDPLASFLEVSLYSTVVYLVLCNAEPNSVVARAEKALI